MNYTLLNTRYREYELHNEGDTCAGTLVFNAFSMQAEMAITGGQAYKITPTGFWRNIYEVAAEGTALMTIKYDWKGMTIINSGGDEYKVKREDIWHPHFVLYSNTNVEMMIVKPEYKWLKFKTNYEISINPSFAPLITPFMVLAVSAAICIAVMRSGAAVAGSVH